MRIEVRGLVQGVGFRPHACRLAERLGLGGSARNTASGLVIEVEGDGECVGEFLRAVRETPPPMAHVRDVRTEYMEPLGERLFRVAGSAGSGVAEALVPPDLAVCDECLSEFWDPSNRRHRHPFINCTNCGPRHTIILDMPYDRVRTSMSGFAMCGRCRAEYGDPANRRFHAEAICCPECGPQLRLTDSRGRMVASGDPAAVAAEMLATGAILAVKGIGGYHLACDAANAAAVRELRCRKRRDAKPFALMAKDAGAVLRVAEMDGGELRLLRGPERPIVLLAKRNGVLPEEIAPDSGRFGVMLPYTPVHHLLTGGDCPVLVMTSGNVSDEPIAHEDDDALRRLGPLADAFLTHDRRIHTRTDDSVAHVAAGHPRFLRRSRGYAPFPVQLPCGTTGAEILATGAELSVTACLTRAGSAYMSHHAGDVGHLSAWEAFLCAVGDLKTIFGVEPAVAACDLHPSFATTRYARETGLSLVRVQHHHAHIASVLAEHRRTDRVIGVAYDGFGLGDDGRAWGGEVLVCDLVTSRRAGGLRGMPLPGGDATARKPARMAYVMLRSLFGDDAASRADRLLPRLSPEERLVLDRTLADAPECTSMGRLFDAAAALLGICDDNTHHAQAPLALEGRAGLAKPDECGYYTAPAVCGGSGHWEVSGAEILRGMIVDYLGGRTVGACARAFHESVARATLDICLRVRKDTGLETAALSGGCFMNALLLERCAGLLRENGFEVLANGIVPAGDGGLSLGQAAVAAWRRHVSCNTHGDTGD